MNQLARSLAGLGGALALFGVAHAQSTPSSTADFNVGYIAETAGLRLVSQLEGTDSPGFLVFAGLSESFSPATTMLLGSALVGPDGRGELFFQVPPSVQFKPNTEVFFFAVYVEEEILRISEGRSLLLGALTCETLTFNDLPGGPGAPQTGEIITNQYASAGVNISADNKFPGGPDLAIIFDSNPPPNPVDPDLVTPGPGQDNDTALGNLLICAENDIDADLDGLIDSPDDELFGANITFDFDAPVQVCETTLIDLDEGGAQLRLFLGATQVGQVTVTGKGENSASVIGVPALAVDRFVVDLFGSGGIGQLRFIPCPSRIGFDETTTGTELNLPAGQIIDDEFASLGIQVSAISNLIVTGTNTAILFDTGNPSDDDADLATPGPGIGNSAPLGRALIIAEDVNDGNNDGVVDVPDDDAAGGRLVFDFAFDVLFVSGTVIDIDTNEVASFDLFDGGGGLLDTIPLASLGDNSVQTSGGSNVGGVRRIVLNLSGSGALAELVFCPDLGGDKESD